MQTLPAAVLAIALAAAAGLAGMAWAQQQRWAAIDPNREVSSAVVWGASEVQAKERAVEACEKVSKRVPTALPPPTIWATCSPCMCCARPKLGCAVAAAESREDAQTSVRKNLTDAGYSSCTLRHYMSAGNGKKQ
jgi:hypothetical protein